MDKKNKKNIPNIISIILLLFFITVFAVTASGCGETFTKTDKLCDAIEEGDNEKAKELADKMWSLNSHTFFARFASMFEGEAKTPLYSACKTGNSEMITYLLEHGASPNYAPYGMPYPLEIMCDMGLNAGIDSMRELLDNGADPAKYNYKPPVYYIVWFLDYGDNYDSYINRINMIMLLLERGSPWTCDDPHLSLIHSAAYQRDGALMNALLEKEESAKYINMKNEDGKTPLDIAIEYNKPEIAMILRNHGAVEGSR